MSPPYHHRGWCLQLKFFFNLQELHDVVLPGKSAGGNGSFTSFTLDSNSSILSCKYNRNIKYRHVLVACTASHVCNESGSDLGRGRHALYLSSLLCQLFRNPLPLLICLVRHFGPGHHRVKRKGHTHTYTHRHTHTFIF